MRVAILTALKGVVKHAGKSVSSAVRTRVYALLKDLIDNEDDQIRSSAASILGMISQVFANWNYSPFLSLLDLLRILSSFIYVYVICQHFFNFGLAYSVFWWLRIYKSWYCSTWKNINCLNYWRHFQIWLHFQPGLLGMAWCLWSLPYLGTILPCFVHLLCSHQLWTASKMPQKMKRFTILFQLSNTLYYVRGVSVCTWTYEITLHALEINKNSSWTRIWSQNLKYEKHRLSQLDQMPSWV